MSRPTASPHQSETLVHSLLNADAYPHPVSSIELLETHISWIILTGKFAYKIKKPVDLEFVDFSTLDRREHFCHEELRLNRRLAPSLYLEVVPITGTPTVPHVHGPGPALEFAVQMRQFDQSALLSKVIQRGELRRQHIDAVAQMAAEFHQQIQPATLHDSYGDLESVIEPARTNLQELDRALPGNAHGELVAAISSWTEQQFGELNPVFVERKEQGFIRECHGDMHLGNMFLAADDQVAIFDCIEFNDDFRWIDVQNEVAFCFMDLLDHQRTDLAHRFLNAYLEHTGDYEGLAVLRFYAVYRSLVRGKVASTRLAQQDQQPSRNGDLERALHNYLELGRRLTQPTRPLLIITHGPSGCGKTQGSQSLVESMGAIRIRSDMERKRIFNLPAVGSSNSALGAGMYSETATSATYERLAELAGVILRAGFTVVVDATFLRRTQRQSLRQLARQCGVPFQIYSFMASAEQTRTRIARRLESGTDASEASLEVFEHQLDTQEPLTEAELKETTVIRTDQ